MLHPVVARAARGELPEWAVAREKRRAHIGRVADLLERWATALELGPDDVARWRAAGFLHDSLHDADPEQIRPLVPLEFKDAPGKLLHGPAAAERLRRDGVEDEELLLALTWHTLGHERFGPLGKALYLADYTEPGREYDSDQLAGWRERAPAEMDAVLRDVAAHRIGRSLGKGRPLMPQTVAFWNGMLNGRP